MSKFDTTLKHIKEQMSVGPNTVMQRDPEFVNTLNDLKDFLNDTDKGFKIMLYDLRLQNSKNVDMAAFNTIKPQVSPAVFTAAVNIIVGCFEDLLQTPEQFKHPSNNLEVKKIANTIATLLKQMDLSNVNPADKQRLNTAMDKINAVLYGPNIPKFSS